MDTYTQAVTSQKRKAQSDVVGLIRYTGNTERVSLMLELCLLYPRTNTCKPLQTWMLQGILVG
jgi:hypothetical protein